MKRATTLFAVLAGWASLTPAGALAATSATGSSSVTADVANTLEATFPGNYAWGSLAAGTASSSSEQLTTVKSNAPWGVKVATDLADGRMKEFSGGSYVAGSPKVLTHPLEWTLSSLGGIGQSGSWTSFSNAPTLIAGSQAATGDSGTTVGVTYRQDVSYADQSAGAADYRIQVAFTAQQGF